MFDYLIAHASIIDGTGRAPYRGAVALRGDRIEAIIPAQRGAKIALPRAKKTIDADGRALAPGFIDIHSHNDWLLPDPDHIDMLQHLMRQGVTTVVTGQCGLSPAPIYTEKDDEIQSFVDLLCDRQISFDYSTMNAFFESLESKGIALNMAHLAGHATLRASLKGLLTDARLTIADMARLEYALDECFAAGVFGLSYGLGYPPGMFSPEEELVWFAKIAGRKRGVLAVHLKALSAVSPTYPYIPGGTPHNLMSLKETITHAKKAGVALQISHLVFPYEPTWKTEERAIGMIEKEYEDGLDIAFDAYPYAGGNTSIIAPIPVWFLDNFQENLKSAFMMKKLVTLFRLSKKVLKFDMGAIMLLRAFHKPYEKYAGRLFRDIAADLGMDPIDAYLHFAEITEGKARVLLPEFYDNDGRDGIMARVLAHPLCRFETDTLITRKGVQNPATFGTFPRILGRFVREFRLMSLPDAIHRMTGASARRMGIQKRGEIKKGYYADLVIFDPDTVHENPVPDQPPLGIEHVFINGKPAVVNNTVDMKRLHGRVLRKNDQ